MFREFILFALIGSTVARSFYRRDYQYFHEFEAFYKFHWDDKVGEWDDALTKCSGEGATLFYPANAEELSVVTSLTAAAPQYDAKQIWVGIHDEFQVGEFLMVDGYVFKRETHKCYKIHNELKPWNEAYEQCYKEGAMLVVPETFEEFQDIIRLAQSNDNSRDNRYGQRNNGPKAYFIGIHKRGQEFFTTKGVSMASEGVYQRWYDGNYGQSPLANCVAIDDVANNNDLYYKTEDCYMRLRFICEMKV